MFTGLIEEIGEVTAIEPLDNALRLTVSAHKALEGVEHGDSIAVSGVCLTAIHYTDSGFTADVMGQTLAMSSLEGIEIGRKVNLERAAQVGDRLGGHIVQGHVDGTATVAQVRSEGNWRVLRFELARDLARLLVDKGSVTVDGVSLTVSNISPAAEASQWFEVSLIPETLTATTLGSRSVGDLVNIETDIIARHVERMRAFDGDTTTSQQGGNK